MTKFDVTQNLFVAKIHDYDGNHMNDEPIFYLCDNWETAFQWLSDEYIEMDGRNYADFEKALNEGDCYDEYVNDGNYYMNAVFEIVVMPVYHMQKKEG